MWMLSIFKTKKMVHLPPSLSLSPSLLDSMQRIEIVKEEYVSQQKENRMLLKYVNNLISTAGPIETVSPSKRK